LKQGIDSKQANLPGRCVYTDVFTVSVTDTALKTGVPCFKTATNGCIELPAVVHFCACARAFAQMHKRASWMTLCWIALHLKHTRACIFLVRAFEFTHTHRKHFSREAELRICLRVHPDMQGNDIKMIMQGHLLTMLREVRARQLG